MSRVQYIKLQGEGKTVFNKPSTNHNDKHTVKQSVTQDSTKRIYIQCLYSTMSEHTKRSDMDHTVLPPNYSMPAFFRKHSPDGATPNWGGRHLIGAYYSRIDPEGMRGWVSLVGWPIVDGLSTYVVTHQLQVERRTGKFAGQRPTLYRCCTQPSSGVVNWCVNFVLKTIYKKWSNHGTVGLLTVPAAMHSWIGDAPCWCREHAITPLELILVFEIVAGN